MDKRVQFHVWYVVAAVIGVILLQQLWVQTTQVDILPYSVFLDDLKAGKIAEVSVSGNYMEGDVQGAAGRQARLRHQPRAAGHRRATAEIRRQVLRRRAEQLPHRPALLGAADGAVLRRLVVRHPPHGGPGRRRRLHGDRPQQGQGLCRDRHQGHLRRRGRRRRGQGGAEGGRRLPQGPRGIRPARRARAQGHPAGGAARHRQDAARARRRGRSRACRSSRSTARNSSRCSSASAPPASATSSSRRGRRRRRSSSSTSSTRSAAPVAPIRASAATTRRSRR